MMYRAGLTVREIADNCGYDVRTVNRHVRVREKYEPDFYTAHLNAFEKREKGRPSTRWKHIYIDLQVFWNENQRLPSYGGNNDESRLHRWLSEQRRLNERGNLSSSKTKLLNEIPGWTLSTRASELDARWQANFEAFVLFVQDYGRFPRYKNFSSERERALGVWLHSQHQRRSNGVLRSDRSRALDNAVPGWKSLY